MKIIFDKIITNKDTLKISLDNGATSVEKPVSELLSNGYPFTEDDCLDLNNIQLGNKSVKKPSFTTEQNNVFKGIARYYAITSADLADYLSTLEDNTSDNPYKIKLLDLTDDAKNALTSHLSKFVDIKIENLGSSILPSAFVYCNNIVSVIIPDGVIDIGNNAFASCQNMTSITIPSSVNKIGDYAFYCPKLKTINYKGTEDQWRTINKAGAWNFNVPSDCVINYNYQG